ncbi:DUF397 domain-containing protein [Fodinicola feengrottensis]|uniref:DUF397 domain-containing protein n=1 Tax=Fodinicola feengrottensis TaxID=435914 RepID=A0ABP4STZ7_9ACTN|nr:DUF397 domain-containing protein [Fodinicola feengrottensis]
MDSRNHLTWRKSRRSGNNGGACVEVTQLQSDDLVVRDSKLGDISPLLTFTTTNWRTFVEAIRTSH